jgi:hypothetical protein
LPPIITAMGKQVQGPTVACHRRGGAGVWHIEVMNKLFSFVPMSFF